MFMTEQFKRLERYFIVYNFRFTSLLCLAVFVNVILQYGTLIIHFCISHNVSDDASHSMLQKG